MADGGNIGILAYGSLMSEPGNEIAPLIERRISTTTPFPVEYARFSQTRANSATVVPHDLGTAVKAEVLVLDDAVSLQEAMNVLWRRETRNEGTGKEYQERSSPNAIVIRVYASFHGLDHVLYTDFHQSGKISAPEPRALARAAVYSVATAEAGRDGITYLMTLLISGVVTRLTPNYEQEILALTGATSLAQALQLLKDKKMKGESS